MDHIDELFGIQPSDPDFKYLNFKSNLSIKSYSGSKNRSKHCKGHKIIYVKIILDFPKREEQYLLIDVGDRTEWRNIIIIGPIIKNIIIYFIKIINYYLFYLL